MQNIKNKEQLNENFEQEVIAFLNCKEGKIIKVFKDVDVIGYINSKVLRNLDTYDKSCFKF